MATTHAGDRPGGRPATPRDLHRLAALARERGVRLLREAASGGWYATSASRPDTIYFVTALSCTCPGFCHHGRCTHNSLLLDRLGWLPEVDDEDPEPDPAAPAAVASPTAPCPECRGRGSELVEARSGDWYRVPCYLSGGRGRVEAGAEPDGLDGGTGRYDAPHDRGRLAA